MRAGRRASCRIVRAQLGIAGGRPWRKARKTAPSAVDLETSMDVAQYSFHEYDVLFEAIAPFSARPHEQGEKRR